MLKCKRCGAQWADNTAASEELIRNHPCNYLAELKKAGPQDKNQITGRTPREFLIDGDLSRALEIINNSFIIEYRGKPPKNSIHVREVLEERETSVDLLNVPTTNSNWPHEKKLHDELTQLREEIGILERGCGALTRELAFKNEKQIPALKEVIAELTHEKETIHGVYQQRISNLKEELTQLRKERDELRYLFYQSAKLVMPGEVDTPDAYLKMFTQLREQNEKLVEEMRALRCDADYYLTELLHDKQPVNPYSQGRHDTWKWVLERTSKALAAVSKTEGE